MNVARHRRFVTTGLGILSITQSRYCALRQGQSRQRAACYALERAPVR